METKINEAEKEAMEKARRTRRRTRRKDERVAAGEEGVAVPNLLITKSPNNRRPTTQRPKRLLI